MSIKLHFQVRLSSQSAIQHRDWNSEVSLALSTDRHSGHGADPLDYVQSALIGRHLQNVLQSEMSHHTVFSSFNGAVMQMPEYAKKLGDKRATASSLLFGLQLIAGN